MTKSIDSMYEKIKEIGENNAGIVTTRQIEEAGIYRGVIKNFVEEDKQIS